MRAFKNSLLLYLGLGIIISYALGWSDLIGNGWLSGDIFEDVTKSIEYYFAWVLIYWWVFILGASLFLATATALIFNYYQRIKIR